MSKYKRAQEIIFSLKEIFSHNHSTVEDKILDLIKQHGGESLPSLHAFEHIHKCEKAVLMLKCGNPPSEVVDKLNMSKATVYRINKNLCVQCKKKSH